MKKLLALTLVVLTLISAAIPAMAASASIRKTEYEGSGKVEVDFKKDVQYKNAKVTVKDSSGKSYTAKITEKDEDDLKYHRTEEGYNSRDKSVIQGGEEG